MSWETFDIDETGGAYTACFGKTVSGTVYDNGNGLTDNFTKAVNLGAASGASGYAMTPLVYDKEVIDITREATPLQTIIPKRTNVGRSANYYRLTGRSNASWVVEDAAIEESDDTREAVSTDIKFLNVAGRVTGPSQAASQHFYNALNEEVMQKQYEMIREIENALINGDTATTATEPNGLIKLLTSNNTAVSGSITLSDVNDLIDDCLVDGKGRPNLLITDPRTMTAIRSQLYDFARVIDNAPVAWGAPAIAFNSNVGVVPLMSSEFMPGASGSRRVLAVQTKHIEQRVLVDVMFEPLSKTNDSTKFFLKSYRCNICKAPEMMGQLTDIST